MKIQNKRILKLLQELDKSKTSMTCTDLSALLGVSKSTIRRDIKELDNLLKNFGVSVFGQSGKGYKISNPYHKNYIMFKENYNINCSNNYTGVNIVPFDYNDRISFIIARILLNSLHNRIVNQEELADELFISLSTLKKYLLDIKKSLSRFNLKLITDRLNGVRIDGEESKIRYCISEYIFNREDLLNLSENKFFNDIFPKEEIESTKDILMKVILHHNIHLTDIAFKNLLVHIVITMCRANDKNSVEYSIGDKEKLRKSKYFDAATEILKNAEHQLGINLNNEVYYLTQHFIASQKFIESSKSRDEYKELIHIILQKIKANTGFDLFDDKELLSGLTIHLLAAINRLKFNMNIRNDILVPIKNNYPIAFEMAILASKVIEAEKKVSINEDEIGFLAIHFGASLERNKLNEEMGKSAIIVCGAGLSTALLIKTKLQRRYGGFLRIKKVMSYYELTPQVIKNVDYIFSTVPITNIKSEKIIKIDPIMTEDDLERVKQKLLINEGVNDLNYQHFFKRDLFLLNFSAKSAHEAINKIANIMIKKGYITNKIKESIFAREKMASTEIGNLVAIPHALENNMNEPAIAVTILKDPIVWGTKKIRIIFLLSVPKKLYRMWEPIIASIYKNFIEKNGVNKIAAEPNFDRLLELLSQAG